MRDFPLGPMGDFHVSYGFEKNPDNSNLHFITVFILLRQTITELLELHNMYTTLSFVTEFTPVFGDFRGKVGYPLEMYFQLCTCVFYYYGQETAATPVSNM